MAPPVFLKWLLVAAARPNFMKIAPLMRVIAKQGKVRPVLVHTGQHYDENMSDAFFRDLGIPAPDVYLGIGSGSHAEQTGRVMIAFEKVLLHEKPDLVLVVGDVNSTMACALAAVKLHIPVAHVEAGLRSFDRTMPEEINRIVTDAVSDDLFTTSPDDDENLLHEGVAREKIHLVGDIMVDSVLYHLEQAKQTSILDDLGLKMERGSNVFRENATARNGIIPYALVTLHRPANVDNRESFARIIDGLQRVAAHVPVLFPMHPRTRKQVAIHGLEPAFTFHEQFKRDTIFPAHRETGSGSPSLIHAFPPLGYLEFLNLMAHAAVVLTDSGGIQQETTVINVPCVTLRDTTERPITLTEGTNVLVHDNPDRIEEEALRALEGRSRRSACPSIWDGRTAERIVATLLAKGKEPKG
ncbi:MAG: UDP-N-acetylglucosamine 2-epimerase (non-hydrolyzing) [Deltaproteobacteria bacterium HGW-Deltaproteobacteria-19]|jgi:UDP-N-acetylglucosamine 2-epimerase (non-hydrolysing)|nr:MAG: UDP-N-acetylglucosamine 2-epimerase (non-hydrolyzing) [Deltaproteobacteria bacterium HGW-Deltaproteobacteria-19]